ncbi:28S ribosomal protein S29, mitochondrial [Orchesella cincta]|uniref:Small ribosomal subunit protein mS29 n=1 Tax=Orchesella cincta TaxID=48709 RepID=A0A1D2MQJ5_ORCCI|nr:28S ribosomal protein S29, mitochondrial [Orchesella cincta]
MSVTMLRNFHLRLVKTSLDKVSYDAKKSLPTRLYCSATSLASPSHESTGFFRTSETNPVNLNEKHLGRFYSIDNEIYQKLYVQHHGFPLEYREQCKVFREQLVLVRKPYLDLKRCVDAVDLKKPVVRFVLHGVFGSGKSMTLGSMAHYGYTKDFILIHLPWIPLWTRYCKEIVPSITREGFFDHTINAVAWLTNFKNQNIELIQKLNLLTSKDYQWSKREVTGQGSELLAIVEHGISRPAHATECMYAVFKELKTHSSEEKCKTMVLADGVNELFYPCKWIKGPDRKPVPPTQLTAYEAMKDLFKTDWTGGVVIVTVDKAALHPDFRESDLPRYLLKKEGWELFDPFVPIEVNNYTAQEVQTTIDYYLERKWLQHPASSTEEGRLELEYLSTRNPRTLMELCNSSGSSGTFLHLPFLSFRFTGFFR